MFTLIISWLIIIGTLTIILVIIFLVCYFRKQKHKLMKIKRIPIKIKTPNSSSSKEKGKKNGDIKNIRAFWICHSLTNTTLFFNVFDDPNSSLNNQLLTPFLGGLTIFSEEEIKTKLKAIELQNFSFIYEVFDKITVIMCIKNKTKEVLPLINKIGSSFIKKFNSELEQYNGNSQPFQAFRYELSKIVPKYEQRLLVNSDYFKDPLVDKT